jgi:hypothetical protein
LINNGIDKPNCFINVLPCSGYDLPHILQVFGT